MPKFKGLMLTAVCALIVNNTAFAKIKDFLERLSDKPQTAPFANCERASTFTTENPYGALPIKYYHCPVPEQIKMYRSIYTPLSRVMDLDSGKDISLSELDFSQNGVNTQYSLALVLENAFALVHYAISSNEPTRIGDRGTVNKKEYLQILNAAYRMYYLDITAKRDDLITINAFENYNLVLAHIMESYNSNTPVDYGKLFYHCAQIDPYAYGFVKSLELFEPDPKIWLKKLSENLGKFKLAIEAGRTKDDFYYLSSDAESRKNLKTATLNYVEALQEDILSSSNPTMARMIALYTRYNLLEAAYRQGVVIPSIYFMGIPVETERSIYVTKNVKQFELKSPIKNVLFMLYSIPKTNAVKGIAIGHFIEQFLNENFSGYLASFDVSSTCPVGGGISDVRRMPDAQCPVRVGKQPHYGAVEGTYEMVIHDIDHVVLQQEEWLNCNERDRKPLRRKLRAIYEMRKNLEPNEAKIVEKAFFYFIHEFPAYCQVKLDDNYFTELATYLRKEFSFETGVLKKRTRRYKEDFLDWAISLAGLVDEKGQEFFNAQGQPYDPEKNVYVKKLTVNGKLSEAYKKSVDNAYERFWNYVIKLKLKDY